MDTPSPRTSILLALLAALLFPSHATAQAPSTLPGASVQAMLIKNTIVAVNHGNLTGNYTVLRDLASERFRKQNTASDLAATFANLRKQGMDLSPILVAEPQLLQPPAEDKFRGRLQLVGYFPTQPLAVHFNLIFQQVSGGWMIDEISVSVASPQPASLPPVSPPQTASRQLPSTSRHR